MARRAPGWDPDALIAQYQHLTNLPRASEALLTIQKIGSMVKPIMRQRSWKVGTLAEFLPTQTNLLGLNTNHGQKIQLRLRYPGDRNQFLPLDEVLDTMLHELCHNVIGPHNQQFQTLWAQLRDEAEALRRKGYTGEGFLGHGQAVGGRRLPLHEASRLARQAAEQRRLAAERSKGSGQRLGGTGIMRGQDPRNVIADAVERRLRIERGCASGTEVGESIANEQDGKGVTTTQAAPETENDDTMMQAYIDLIQEEEREKFGGYYEPPSAANPAGSRGTPGTGKAQTLVEQQRQIELDIAKQEQKQVQKPVPPVRNPPKGLPSRPSPISRPPTTSRPRPVSSTERQPSLTAPTARPIPKPTLKQPQPLSDTSTESEDDVPPPVPRHTETLLPATTTWTCEICTLVNPLSFLSCDACGIERPASISASLSPPPTDQSNTLQGTAARRKQRETPNVLQPRSNAYDSISRFSAERAEKIAKGPVGWRCRCGNFMEAEWWTCARCGRMKESS